MVESTSVIEDINLLEVLSSWFGSRSPFFSGVPSRAWYAILLSNTRVKGSTPRFTTNYSIATKLQGLMDSKYGTLNGGTTNSSSRNPSRGVPIASVVNLSLTVNPG